MKPRVAAIVATLLTLGMVSGCGAPARAPSVGPPTASGSTRIAPAITRLASTQALAAATAPQPPAAAGPDTLRLNVADPTLAVGQSTTVNVTVTAANGAPLQGVPVTVGSASACTGPCVGSGAGAFTLNGPSAGPRPLTLAASTNWGAALLSNGTVWQWVDQPYQVSGLSGVTSIAVGVADGYALEGNGTVWRWADGAAQEMPGLKDITSIATGYNTGYAMQAGGRIWEWGWNTDGALGDGSSNPNTVTTPQLLTGLPPIKEISGGYFGAVAVAKNGTLWAWGRGYGLRPEQIPGISTAVAAAVGQSNPVVLLADGTVATVQGDAVVPVPGLRDVVQVAAASAAYLALTSDGTVWAWGASPTQYGVLGNGTLTGSAVPVEVKGLPPAVDIAAGLFTGMALTAGGRIWAWGVRHFGPGMTPTLYGDVPVEIHGMGHPGGALTTNAQGVAEEPLTATGAGQAAVQVSGPDGTTTEQTLTILPAGDTIADLPATVMLQGVPASAGSAAATVSACVLDASGQPLAHALVTFQISTGGTTQVAGPLATNLEGRATTPAAFVKGEAGAVTALVAPPGGHGAWAEAVAPLQALPRPTSPNCGP